MTRTDVAHVIIDVACASHNVCLTVDKCDDELLTDNTVGNGEYYYNYNNYYYYMVVDAH